MSSNDESRERAVPPFHEVLANARARRETPPPAPPREEPGTPPSEAQLAAARRTPLCAYFQWLVDWYVGWRCSQKFNRMAPCDDAGLKDCPCVAGDDGHGHCVEARIPELRPCVSIHWGDDRCDCIEGNDTEVLCITVCNCYSNVTFRDVTISYVFVTNAETLPDGTPSVDIRPLGPICFGDIPPCTDGRGACVSREVVMMLRGARPGSYTIEMGNICYSVAFDYESRACFTFDVCRD